jgi:glycosyltransferase involved in cell wall biosynthesis
MATGTVSVTIVSDKNSGCPNAEKIAGIPIDRINHLTWAPIFRKKSLIKTILKSKPDLIVWYGTPLSAAFLTQLRSIGKPLIWDMESEMLSLKILNRISFREIHPHHTSLWQQVITALFPRFIIRIVANSALISKIIVPSRCLKMSLCKIGVEPGKIAIVPSTIEKDACNCSNIDEKPKESKKKAGFKPDDLIVTYFGAPCTLRGVDTAILSMPKILMKRKDVKLVIFSRRDLGEFAAVDRYIKAEEENLLKLVRRLRLEEYVRIIPGMLNKLRLKQYLCASDIIVLPFKLVFSEPPLSVLEAMSLGKVVVTTDVGSLSEIVGDDRGILIGPNNADALARVVLFLADHQEKVASIGKNAQRFAASLPDWEQVTLQFEEVLHETIQRTGVNPIEKMHQRN